MPLPVMYAILAAALFGLSAPFSKLLVGDVPPLFLAALLYLGAGAGMFAVNLLRRSERRHREEGLDRKDARYVVAMIALDIAAPIFLMYGIRLTTAATAALLGNFEIVTTALAAMLLFREGIGRRLWAALGLITVASAVLSVDDFASLSISPGALLVLLSCLCWGLENNCTRMLSLKDPMQIVVVKGIGSGLGALVLALGSGDYPRSFPSAAAALVLGFLAYGLSIYCYVTAQRSLGAARTGAYYAFAPFIGVLASLALFDGNLTPAFVVALPVMLAGVYLVLTEDHAHEHAHAYLAHAHRHGHDDGHHLHDHSQAVRGEHSHPHEHPALTHAHDHTPDLHHDHDH